MIQERRIYSMSDAKLWETTNRVLIGAQRDVTELTTYSIDQAALNALDAENDAFSNLPTDVELSQTMAGFTEARNAKRFELTTYLMVEIMARVELKFGLDSRTYKQFASNTLYNTSDAEFFFAARRITRKASSYQADLDTKGFSLTKLAAANTLITQFDDCVQAQDQSIEDRDSAVRTRVLAGNALYTKVAEISNLGKRLWLNVNESKYNDYVLYPNQTTEPQGQVVESPVGAGKVVNLSVTDVDANSEILAENLTMQGLILYFSASPADLPPNTMPNGPGWLAGMGSASGKASELDFKANEREYLNAYNPGPNEGSVKVTVV